MKKETVEKQFAAHCAGFCSQPAREEVLTSPASPASDRFCQRFPNGGGTSLPQIRTWFSGKDDGFSAVPGSVGMEGGGSGDN